MRALTLNLGGECCGIPHCIAQLREMLVLVDANTKRLHPPPSHGCVSICARLGSGFHQTHSQDTFLALRVRLARPSRAGKKKRTACLP